MSATTLAPGDPRPAHPTPAAPGTEVRGPTALGSDPRRFWNLTRTLAVMEFKLSFFGSALGYLWQLMRPLMLFGILYFIFSSVLRLGSGVAHYPVALLLGVVLFMFFSEATGGAVTCLIDRENLVRKIEFPRLAVPVATVLTAIFNLTLNLVAVFIFLLADGGGVSVRWLELPLLVALLAVYSLGIGMLLSALFVRYRDVKPIWDVVLQASFYAAPIFYPITLAKLSHDSLLGVKLKQLLLFNPFSALLQQARHAVIAPSHPSAGKVLGGWAELGIPVGVALLVVAVGYWVFSHEAPRVAERL